MITDEFFFVTIEFGSSKVTGIAGKRQNDGSIQVLALAQEESSSFINKGIIFNVDKTSQCLRNIVERLQKNLKKKIGKVYVGIGGQSLRSKRNVISIPLADDTVVTQELVDSMLDGNLSTEVPDCSILDVIPQEYKVGTQLQSDPVGVLCDNIEGRFLNIVARKSVHDVMASCFQQAGIDVCDYYISPISLAEGTLTDSEKRSGCVLVDLGAATTTVLVYKSHLRHLVVIPLGCDNINKDLVSIYDIEHSEAEELKIKYGAAFVENGSEVSEDSMVSLKDGRSIKEKDICDIIEARTEEIVANVSEQIRLSGLSRDNILAGIILTGGGSNMRDITKAFTRKTKIDKIKIAKTVLFTVHTSIEEITANNGRMNTALCLLTKGTENCCAGDINEIPPTLFGDEHIENGDMAKTVGDGLTELQRRQKKAEEDKKIKEEEEAKRAIEKAKEEEEARKEKEKEEKEQRKREAKARRKEKLRNNIFTKLAKNVGESLKKIVSDSEDYEDNSTKDKE